MSEEGIEIKEIVSPRQAKKEMKNPSATVGTTRQEEARELAAEIARNSGKPVAIIERPDGIEIRQANRDELKVQAIGAEIKAFQPPVPQTAILSEPVASIRGKSSGNQWSHPDGRGNPRGPGSHKKLR